MGFANETGEEKKRPVFQEIPSRVIPISLDTPYLARWYIQLQV
jgi:hypothetical protein